MLHKLYFQVTNLFLFQPRDFLLQSGMSAHSAAETRSMYPVRATLFNIYTCDLIYLIYKVKI